MIYYNKSIEKSVKLFGFLFSDIHIRRWMSDKSKKKDLLVPLRYMDKQRMYYLINNKMIDLNANKIDSVYPLMAYSISDIYYDSSRQLNPQFIRTNNYYDSKIKKDIPESEYMAVPYNIKFTLTIASIQRSDLFQILEQILVWFQPSLSIRANMNPFIGDDKISIPIKLDSTQFNDFNNTAPFSETEDKPLEYNLNFIMKTYLYRMNLEDEQGNYPGGGLGKPIKEIEAGVTFFDDKRPVTDDSLYTIHIPEHIG